MSIIQCRSNGCGKSSTRSSARASCGTARWRVLQVTDTPADMVELRALVSARNAGQTWDLRCEVREKLIAFLSRVPAALPRQRDEFTDRLPGQEDAVAIKARGRRRAAVPALSGPLTGCLALRRRRRAPPPTGRSRMCTSRCGNGHLDPVLLERVPQPEQHLALDVGDAVCRILDPKAEQQIDGAVAEPGHVTDRRGRREHALRPLRDRDGEFAHRVQIAAIGDAERHIEPHQQARIGPVDDLVGDQVLVRDQVFLAVSAAHRGIARARDR